MPTTASPDRLHGAVQPFEDVVAEHGAVVMRVCRAMLTPADADDAWAETFLAALRAYPDLRPDSNVRGWLVTIAHRRVIDQVRASARRPLPVNRVPEAPTAEVPADPDTDLWAALEALPPKQRGAVVYHHLAGMPYAEVAVLLDSSEDAARRSAADGIARLRTTYSKESPR
jgi:RNA polymerase sigma factor (sigma-70 family)